MTEDTPMQALLNSLPQTGEVLWIGLRPGHRQPVEMVEGAEAVPGNGLVGESQRQVTLIQAEHLAAVGSFLGSGPIDPALLRRNIVVSGLNLLALKDKRFRMGKAALEYTGLCHPCSRMEETLGPGGYNAMRGHGGITAKVIREGTIRVGDRVYVAKGD